MDRGRHRRVEKLRARDPLSQRLGGDGMLPFGKYLSTIVQVWLDAFPKKWPETPDIANKRRQGTLLRQTGWRERRYATPK